MRTFQFDEAVEVDCDSEAPVSNPIVRKRNPTKKEIDDFIKYLEEKHRNDSIETAYKNSLGDETKLEFHRLSKTELKAVFDVMEVLSDNEAIDLAIGLMGLLGEKQIPALHYMFRKYVSASTHEKAK